MQYLSISNNFHQKMFFMKQLLTSLLIFFISSVLFVACNDKTASSTTEEIKPTFDLAGARKTIDSLNAVFGSMVSKGDSVGLASLYTSDAKFMMPNSPTVSGRSAIQSGNYQRHYDCFLRR